LPASLSDAILQLLIGDALTTQEKQRVSRSSAGSGKSVLIIGGAGRMGRWFAEFLASQGYAVEIADPSGIVEGLVCHHDWRVLTLHHDIIVIATPLRIAVEVMEELAERRPKGLVFDVGSLKGPLRDSLRSLHDAGVRVTSIHPMFGPDTELLSGRHVILVNVGDEEATRAAGALFASTMVEIVPMSLEDHDRLIAIVLGLSHATNIAFFSALSESGEPASKLAGMSSTTFEQQLGVAEKVSQENPSLYFEIQNLNPFGVEVLERLQSVVGHLADTVRAGDEKAFAEMMRAGNEYLRSVRGRDRQ
jgi:chorismate mutase/prephenate dehydrogenase